MPKVKVQRKSISLDMTAMCDMAFLLLTFFMLATQFKAEEAVAVDVPSSASQIVLPDSTAMIMISISKEGGIFLGIDGHENRKTVVTSIGKKFNLDLTDSEIEEFAKLTSFGMPANGLKPLINMSNTDRNRFKQPGIPIDSANNELNTWIIYAKTVNPKYKVAIKGDQNGDYKIVKRLIDILQDINVNKFSLITSLETKPE